jgi:hypothetical protein
LNGGWFSPIVSSIQYDGLNIIAFAPDFNLNLIVALEKALNINRF